MANSAQRNSHRPRHEPSPEEIAARCAEIQLGWSDEQRRNRSVIGSTGEGWIPPRGRWLGNESLWDVLGE